jgi:hypothetical protein
VTVLAVDLAAKLSAACLMDDDHKVIDQFDSWQISEERFIGKLELKFHTWTPPELMVIEDLPHGLGYTKLTKAVCRLQGRIYECMRHYNPDRTILFVAPATWRAHYAEAKRGTGPGIVVPIAEQFGYRPPWTSLMERAKGHGGRSRAGKVSTDYCSAYLIGRWAIDMKRAHNTFDVPGTSRYFTTPILKKDFDAENR